MSKRWFLAIVCAVLGLLMVVGGLLIPIYLRAVDASVVQQAGRDTTALTDQARTLAEARRLGAAQLLLSAGQAERIPSAKQLGPVVDKLANEYPNSTAWGDDEAVANLFASNPQPSSEPFTDFVVRRQNREAALNFLHASSKPAVRELLRCRELTHTVIFPPSQSSSGQAFDAAVSVCGLLLERGHLTPKLSDNVMALATAANRGGSSQPLEQALMDFMSLGQRFNWDQLVAFVSPIEDTATLHQLADEVRNASGELPVLFAAVQLSGNPAGVAKYLADFSQTGMQDLGDSLRFGAGGVNELLRSDQRLYSPTLRQRVTAYNPFGAFFQFALDYCVRTPRLALAAKWLLFLAGGYFFATALHFARPAVSFLEQPLQVRGFHVFREILFALGFLLVALLASEPFLAQESQKGNFSFQLHLPTAGSVVPAGIAGIKQTIMNPIVLLTMLVFFVLQALIYTACLVKLAEIRRQNVPPRMKLKLLENEDHLFDAGLYLGFVGTIVSLIIASLGLVKFSLMAAYSSTSFGIVFVVIFKIFHLRPVRRKLLMEAEAGTATVEPSAMAATTS